MYTLCFPGYGPEKGAHGTESLVSIQLTAHRQDLFLLCCLAVLKEKRLQSSFSALEFCIESIISKGGLCHDSGVMILEMRVMTLEESHMGTVLVMAEH